jgi:hypothetical protein
MSIFDKSDAITKKMKHAEELFIEEQKCLLDNFMKKYPEIDSKSFGLFKKVMLMQTKECYNRGKLDMLAFVINEMRLVTRPEKRKSPEPKRKGA